MYSVQKLNKPVEYSSSAARLNRWLSMLATSGNCTEPYVFESLERELEDRGFHIDLESVLPSDVGTSPKVPHYKMRR